MEMLKIENDIDCFYQLQKDNPDALKYLIHIYFPVLCAYSVRIVRNNAEAEDVTEEVFVKLWERRHSFGDFGEIKGFLYTSIRNASLNIVRSHQRSQQRDETFTRLHQDAENESFVYEEMLAEIRKAIAALPPKMREIFILSYFKKMDNAAIAEYLQLSNQTVRNQKTKALSLLKGILKNKTFCFFLLMVELLK